MRLVTLWQKATPRTVFYPHKMYVKPVCYATVLIVDFMGMSKESIILPQTSIIVGDCKEWGRFKMAVLRTDTLFPSMWSWAKQVTGLIFNSTELWSARLLCLEEKPEILSYKYWWLSEITTLEETMGFN